MSSRRTRSTLDDNRFKRPEIQKWQIRRTITTPGTPLREHRRCIERQRYLKIPLDNSTFFTSPPLGLDCFE